MVVTFTASIYTLSKKLKIYIAASRIIDLTCLHKSVTKSPISERLLPSDESKRSTLTLITENFDS